MVRCMCRRRPFAVGLTRAWFTAVTVTGHVESTETAETRSSQLKIKPDRVDEALS
jgi:hypothetical protein